MQPVNWILGGIQACASLGGCEAGLFAISGVKCLSITECSDKDTISSSVIFVFYDSLL